MKYPAKNHLLLFKTTSDGICVKNILTEQEKMITEEEYIVLSKLDGKTNPYRLWSNVSRKDVDNLMRSFKKRGLLRGSRFRMLGINNIMLALKIPRFKKKHRKIALFLNDALMCAWIPVLILGVFMFIKEFGAESPFLGPNDLLFGNIIGIVLGLVLHEIAHAFAALAYGAKVMEFGVMLYWFLPCAYVLIEDSKVKDRLKRAQIRAAGIEMNMFLGGIFLVLTEVFNEQFYLFLQAATLNILLAVINASFVEGVDGMSVLTEFLGIDDFARKAKVVVKSHTRKRKLKRMGMNGSAFLTACYIIRIFQILLPLMILSSIAVVVGGI